MIWQKAIRSVYRVTMQLQLEIYRNGYKICGGVTKKGEQ